LSQIFHQIFGQICRKVGPILELIFEMTYFDCTVE
jgi:hypothetical protein